MSTLIISTKSLAGVSDLKTRSIKIMEKVRTWKEGAGEGIILAAVRCEDGEEQQKRTSSCHCHGGTVKLSLYVAVQAHGAASARLLVRACTGERKKGD